MAAPQPLAYLAIATLAAIAPNLAAQTTVNRDGMLAQAQAIDAPRLLDRPDPLRELDTEQTINLSEFGVDPNDDVDDRAAIQAGINRAIATGVSTTVVIPAGTYRLSELEPLKYAFYFNKAKNLVIDARGANFVLTEPLAGFMQAANCERMIVRGFTADYDPLPFAQGTIVGIDPSTLSFDVQIDPGFPPIDAPFFTHGKVIAWGSTKDPDLPGRSPIGTRGHVTPASNERLGDGLFRMNLTKPDELLGMTPGQKYIHLVRRTWVQGIRFVNSQNVTVQDVTFYACPGSPFVAMRCDGVALINCQARLKDGRWQSTNADAVHFQRNGLGPWIEGCVFEGTPDDTLNIYTVRSKILDQPDSNTLVLGRFQANDSFETTQPVGEKLMVFNRREGRMVGVATITDVTFDQQTVTVKLDQSIDEVMPGEGFDADAAYLSSVMAEGFVLKDNVFRNGWRHVVIMSRKGRIEGNTFEGINGPGLTITNHNRGRDQAEFFAGGDLIIRGNRFIDNDFGQFHQSNSPRFGFLNIDIKTYDHLPAAGRIVERVLIEDNLFSGWRRAGMNIQNADQVVIRNNRFVAEADVPLDPDTPHAAVYLDNVGTVAVYDNQIEDSRSIKPIAVGPMGVEKLITDNTKPSAGEHE